MKTQLSSNGVPQELWISASRNAIDPIVGAHNTANISIFNTHLKGREEALQHVLLSHLQIKKNKQSWTILRTKRQ